MATDSSSKRRIRRLWSADGAVLAFTSSTNDQDLARAACEESKEKDNDKIKAIAASLNARARHPRHHSAEYRQ